MLLVKIKAFLACCKVPGFKDQSIETSSLRLHEFSNFLTNRLCGLGCLMPLALIRPESKKIAPPEKTKSTLAKGREKR